MSWLDELGYTVLHGLISGSVSPLSGDPNYRDVILEGRVRQALECLGGNGYVEESQAAGLLHIEMGMLCFATVRDSFRGALSPLLFGSYCITPGHGCIPGRQGLQVSAAVTPQCQQIVPITGGTLTFTPMPGTHGTFRSGYCELSRGC